MKKNLFKILGAMAIVMCMSLCFAGCDLFGGPKVKAIELTTQFQTVYEKGESLNVSNGVLKVKYEDDTTKDIFVESSMVSGFDKDTLGQRTMIVTYGGATCTVNYTVTGFKLKDNYLYRRPNGSSGSYEYLYLFKSGQSSYTIYSYQKVGSTLYDEFEALKDSTYRQNMGLNMETGPLTSALTLDTDDYLYKLTFTNGTETACYKFETLNNWWAIVGGETLSMNQYYELYTPAV